MLETLYIQNSTSPLLSTSLTQLKNLTMKKVDLSPSTLQSMPNTCNFIKMYECTLPNPQSLPSNLVRFEHLVELWAGNTPIEPSHLPMLACSTSLRGLTLEASLVRDPFVFSRLPTSLEMLEIFVSDPDLSLEGILPHLSPRLFVRLSSDPFIGTRLFWSILKKRWDLMNNFLLAGDDVNLTTLDLSYYVMMKQRGRYDRFCFDYNTPLRLAARTGNFQAVQTLVNHGAQPLIEGIVGAFEHRVFETVWPILDFLVARDSSILNQYARRTENYFKDETTTPFRLALVQRAEEADGDPLEGREFVQLCISHGANLTQPSPFLGNPPCEMHPLYQSSFCVYLLDLLLANQSTIQRAFWIS